MKDFDLAIRGGQVIDGTGKPAFRADLGLRDGRVSEMGDLGPRTASVTLDVGGLTVAPGFVDSHGHSDFALAVNPPVQSQVAQGFTTEIGGNCGVSPFPLFDDNRGIEFDPPGVTVTWTDAPSYFATVKGRGLGVSFVPQVGHMTIRQHVLRGEDRPAGESEVDLLEALVQQALAAGAKGFSTGLDYHPTQNAATEEVIRLARAAGAYGGLYTSHIRGYGARFPEALTEALAIGKAAGVRLVVSHIAACGASRGRGPWAVQAMAEARRTGQAVACDMMLYPTSGVWWGPRAVFPSWACDWRQPWDKEAPRLQALLGDDAFRSRLRADIEEGRRRPKSGFDEEAMVFGSWDDIWIEEVGTPSSEGSSGGSSGESSHHLGSLVGLSISTAARAGAREPVDVFLDLVAAYGESLSTVHQTIDPGDFDAFLTDPWTMIGTDTVGTSLERSEEAFNIIQAHPRHYGTTARLIGSLARDQGKLSLAEAVRRLTSLPATVYGLQDRGVLRPGAWADIVVFDPLRVRERGTYRRPKAYPEGFVHVLVNGVPAVLDGKTTGATGGRLISLGT